MSIIKDAIKDMGLFKKKNKSTPSDLEVIEQLEKELQQTKNEIIRGNKMGRPKKEIKEETTTPVDLPEIPKIKEEKQEVTIEERLTLLEANVLNILNDFDERLRSIEKFLIKNS